MNEHTLFSTRTRFIALVAALLFLAALLRIYHIIQRPIWTDEGTVTFNLFHFNEQSNLIEGLARRDHHPPLYYWMLQGWMALTGTSVFAMRYLAALLGIICVAVMIPLARQFLPKYSAAVQRNSLHWAYWSVPLLAALLLALSDPDIDLSQEIRFYTLRTLLVMLSVFFYLRWTARPILRRGGLWLLVNVALLYTNYQGAFILAVVGLHALFGLRGRTRWGALAWLALSGAVFLPWGVLVAYGQRLNDQGINSSLTSSWETFSVLVYKFLGQQWPLMSGLLLLGTFPLLVRWAARLTASSDTVLPSDGGALGANASQRTVLLVLWVAFTLGLTFFANQWFSLLSPRRVMLISPALALLIARGIVQFRPPTRLFLALVLLVYGVTTVDDYYPKAPWDRVAADMVRYADPDQLVLLEIYYDDVVLFYYADTLMPPNTRVESLRLWRQYHQADYPNGLLDIINQYQTVWLVHWEKEVHVFDFLAQSGFTPTAVLTTDHWGNALNVYRFDRQRDIPPLVTFSNGLTLRRATLNPPSGRVELWWSAETAPSQDYTTSVFILNAQGQLVAQHDAFPLENRHPTSTWQAGELAYDPHPLDFASLPVGTYTVAAQVYTYWDGVRYPPDDGSGAQWFVLGTYTQEEQQP